MKLRIAERKQVRIKLALQGPAGSGKTYGALLLAKGLCGDWSKVAVIDTEGNSADLYAHLGNYNILSINAPYSPEKYAEAIATCEREGMAVIIIDSLSHEWEGDGGILDMHSNMAGNSFTNWAKLTPRHNALVNNILQSPCHIIATIRSKQDYVLTEKNGKQVPEKVGMKGVTRDGMDYEFTLVLEIDIKHHALASKDRTGLFADKPQFKLSEATGASIAEWCKAGTSVDEIKQQIVQSTDVPTLKKLYDSNPDLQEILKPEFTKRREFITSNKQLKPNLNFLQDGKHNH